MNHNTASRYIIQSSTLTDIADAIRAKCPLPSYYASYANGMQPQDMAFKIYDAKIAIGRSQFAALNLGEYSGWSNASCILSEGFNRAFGFPDMSAPFSNCVYVGYGAFCNCSYLEKANFSSPLTIASRAFESCVQLSYIDCYIDPGYPVRMNGLAEIGDSAFQECRIESFHSKFQPNIRIGSYAFWSGYAGSEITIDYNGNYYAHLQEIGDCAFGRCSNLESVVVHDCERIGKWAFRECSKLRYFSITGVMSIGQSAFNSCYSLSSVVLSVGGSRLDIDSYAFQDLSGLTNVSICYDTTGTRCTIFHEGAFGFCSNLSAITIDPSDRACIGTGAFRSCSLASFNAPYCSYVSGYAFAFCRDLASVNIASAKTIGDEAFRGCSQLANISMTSVQSIGVRAFCYCSSLSEISIPNCGKIGYEAFRETRIKSLTLPAVRVLGYKFGRQETAYTADTMDSAAFYGTGIETLTFPKVDRIANYVFQGCNTLKSIYFLSTSKVNIIFTDERGYGTPCSNFLSGIDPYSTFIYVPSSLYSAYISDNQWSWYSNHIRSYS